MPLNLAISVAGKLLGVKGKLQALVPRRQERRAISTGYFPLLRPRFISASVNPGQRSSAMQTNTLWPVLWRCPRLILTGRNGLMSIRVQGLQTVCASGEKLEHSLSRNNSPQVCRSLLDQLTFWIFDLSPSKFYRITSSFSCSFTIIKCNKEPLSFLQFLILLRRTEK